MSLSEFELCFGTDLKELLENTRLKSCSAYVQHGNTSVLLHCVAVAYYSYKLYALFGAVENSTRRKLVRGALLHDYFLYDWHTHKNPKGLHGFCHPQTAFENALRDGGICAEEGDIILHHMFPLTPYPPQSKAALTVCAVDKACSVYEIFCRNSYKSLRKYMHQLM